MTEIIQQQYSGSKAKMKAKHSQSNVDDITGGNGIGKYKEPPKDYSGSNINNSNANVQSIEPYDPGEDGSMSAKGGVGAGASMYEEQYDDEDRPIKPKAQLTYDDRDPEIEGDKSSAPPAHFEPGQHPLEGVPNCYELPAPESGLSKKAR